MGCLQCALSGDSFFISHILKNGNVSKSKKVVECTSREYSQPIWQSNLNLVFFFLSFVFFVPFLVSNGLDKILYIATLICLQKWEY